MRPTVIPPGLRAVRRSAAVVALALVAFLGLVLAGPGGGDGVTGPQRAGACGVLPIGIEVRSKFPKAYARLYRKKVVIELTNRGGYRVGGLLVQIYTFDGLRLGGSGALGSLRSGHSRAIAVKLGVPMQPGKVTVVVKGANKGCGRDEINHVVAFHACQTRLPLTFPNRPGGFASDYSDFLSVTVESKRGQAIFRPRSRVLSFAGAFVGRDVNRYRVIYGKARFDNQLSKPLSSGGYRMIVRGWLNQPKSCGPKTAQVSMGFK